MEGTPASAPSPDATQPSRLSRIEVIEKDLIGLARLTAQAASNLKVKTDFPDDDHAYLIMVLDDLYLLSYEILPKDIRDQMDTFLKSPANKQKTIDAANALIKALDAKGISKFFEEEIEPPFMLEELPEEEKKVKA